jgi:hypothetical protein
VHADKNVNILISTVIPEAPKKVEQMARDSGNPREVSIKWTFPEFKSFGPGLFHKLTVCVQNMTQIPCNTTVSPK